MSTDPVQEFRSLSPDEQIKEGEDSLLSHILERGIETHAKYPNLGMDNLDAFLADRDCVRYPTRIVFEYGAEMAPHQFAQPEQDFRSTEAHAKVIYLRPILKDRPDYAMAAIAYMLPLLNYGDIIGDEHCLIYTASLLGLSEDACYKLICEVADFCGSDERLQSEPDTHTPVSDPGPLPTMNGGSCGSGCGCG